MSPQSFYSLNKLVNNLHNECEKSTPNYQECLRLMKNFGSILNAIEDINELQYQQLWSIARSILTRRKEVPLILRIITIHVYTTLTIKLYSNHHNTAGAISYTLIINEFKDEVSSDSPSIHFLISIFDAIYACSKAGCCNDKETIIGLLSLQEIFSSLTECSKQSIALALDIDLGPFVKLYKYGQYSVKMNNLLQSLGCSKNIVDTQYIFPIPPRKISSLEKRIALQNVLKGIESYQLAQLIIKGFQKFEIIKNYKPPQTTTALIQQLIEEKPIEDIKSSESGIFIIEQALTNLQNNSQYIPITMQSQFISILITTIDFNEPNFEECKGPITTYIINNVISSLKYVDTFLTSWTNYEFIHNSETRYNTLVNIILKKISNNLNNEGLITNYILNLPKLPEEIFQNLQTKEFQQINQILLTINEYIKDSINLQKKFLKCLFQLTIQEDEIISNSSLNIIQNYYQKKEFIMKINKKAIKYLNYSIEIKDNIQLSNIYMELFFMVLEYNYEIFRELIDIYNKITNKLIKNLICKKLKNKIPKMHLFDNDFIKEIIKYSRQNNYKMDLIHIYLDYVSKQLIYISKDLFNILKKELIKYNDPRFLIPIIPTLLKNTPNDFEQYLHYMLNLSIVGLRRALSSLIYNDYGITFIILLNNITKTSNLYNKAIEALKISFETNGLLTYEKCTIAINYIIQNHKSLDLLMNTLYEIICKFTNEKCFKYLFRHILPIVNHFDIFNDKNNWNILKKMIYIAKPISFQFVKTLSYDKINDLIKEYPEISNILKNINK